MKKYVIDFLKRGLMFGGFGPIIAAIVYLVLSYTLDNFSLSGVEVFLAVLSTYLLAFIVAGASVFNQIEEWHLTKSLLVHFVTLYAAYVGCYLVNSWIPFDIKIVLIFTAIFAVTYLVIWLSVFLSVRAVSKKFNKRLQ